MKTLLLILLAGAAPLPQAGPAGPEATAPAVPAPEPSGAALELARLLKAPTFLWIYRLSEEEAIKAAEQKLLGMHYAPRGRSCDPSHPQCRKVALEVARKYGSLEARFFDAFLDEAHARLFDATMSAADLRAATAFFRSGSGGRFAATMRKLAFGPARSDEALLERVFRETALGEREPSEGMEDEYYDRTAGLPRAPMPSIAPPPSITVPERPHSD